MMIINVHLLQMFIWLVFILHHMVDQGPYSPTIFKNIKMGFRNTLNVDRSLLFTFYLILTLSPYKLFFLRDCHTSLLKTVGKGEIAHKKDFSSFPNAFSTLFENFPPFSSNSKLLSANSFTLEEFKICCLGKC